MRFLDIEKWEENLYTGKCSCFGNFVARLLYPLEYHAGSNFYAHSLKEIWNIRMIYKYYERKDSWTEK